MLTPHCLVSRVGTLRFPLSVVAMAPRAHHSGSVTVAVPKAVALPHTGESPKGNWGGLPTLNHFTVLSCFRRSGMASHVSPAPSTRMISQLSVWTVSCASSKLFVCEMGRWGKDRAGLPSGVRGRGRG